MVLSSFVTFSASCFSHAVKAPKQRGCSPCGMLSPHRPPRKRRASSSSPCEQQGYGKRAGLQPRVTAAIRRAFRPGDLRVDRTTAAACTIRRCASARSTRCRQTPGFVSEPDFSRAVKTARSAFLAAAGPPVEFARTQPAHLALGPHGRKGMVDWQRRTGII
jgi:hypothetical protein